MAASHTPGPWTQKFSAQEYQQVIWANGYAIAEVWGTKESDRPADEAEANARLIAAAPDLLDALERLIRTHGGITFDLKVAAEAVTHALKVLAKTRGEIA